MAKRSDLDPSKKTIIGNRRKHKHSEGWKFRAQTTKRRWEPNLRKVTIKVDDNKQKVKVTMKEYKKLVRDGAVVR